MKDERPGCYLWKLTKVVAMRMEARAGYLQENLPLSREEANKEKRPRDKSSGAADKSASQSY